jgi:5-methylcytosine-specific restriction endonuclease McrA
LNKIFEAVKKKFKINFRDDIRYGDYLKLLWNNEHICKECGKKPPDIKLHIDHIIPVSLGGSSDSKNLQFLCSNCNLKKKNKLKGGKP